jgi:hypothetical protein
MSRFGEFNINGTKYDLDELTLDEMEKLEELSGGVPFSELNYGSAKAMKAVAFVLLSRGNPELTWEEVGKVKVLDFMPAEEEMPELPPDSTTEEGLNGSEPVAAGALDSAGSTPG